MKYFLIASCPPIGVSPYEHGSVSVLDAAGHLVGYSSYDRHPIGTRIQFGCLNPYQIVSGPTGGYCTTSGQWSYETFPSCGIGKVLHYSCFYKLFLQLTPCTFQGHIFQTIYICF